MVIGAGFVWCLGELSVMDVRSPSFCSISAHPAPPPPGSREWWMFSILVGGQMYFPGFLLSEVGDPGMFDADGSNHSPTPMTAAAR